MGWLKQDSDVLTRKAMACKTPVPDLTPAVEFAPPIEFAPAAETVVEADYGRQLVHRLFDNELEDDEPPEELPIECEE
jgi:hypothetical protein